MTTFLLRHEASPSTSLVSWLLVTAIVSEVARNLWVLKFPEGLDTLL